MFEHSLASANEPTMYIEEIIIDGFKSYAQRVSISGFDKNFNAITGFNGSGKSNILDAICFVLGITQWGALRAQNAQDLIYKQGQAGVKRASVTIVFNNEDKSMSPAGYESMKKITVTVRFTAPVTQIQIFPPKIPSPQRTPGKRQILITFVSYHIAHSCAWWKKQIPH